MAKQNNNMIWLIAIGVIALFVIMNNKTSFTGAITGTETMTRTVASTTVAPSSTFTLTYTAVGTSGAWGASIVDSVTGGCKFPGATTSLNDVMLSTDGATKTVTITSPASGTCTFTGDYKFGTTATKAFTPNLVVTICAPVCTRPTDLCLASSSNGCGGTCPWTVTKNSLADTNCDNTVSNTELLSYINLWKAGTATRDNLGAAIESWIGGA